MKLSITNHHTIRLIFIGFILLLPILVLAQRENFNSQQALTAWKAKKGVISISNDHYKSDTSSLKWDWSEGDKLTFDLSELGIEESTISSFNSMFRLWVYNTQERPTDSLMIRLRDEEGKVQFYYPYYLNFKGWRSASMGYQTEMLGRKKSNKIGSVEISSPKQGNGVLYFDNIKFDFDLPAKRAPDSQLPFLKTRADHWLKIRDYQLIPKRYAPSETSEKELMDIEKISSRYLKFCLGPKRGSSFAKNAHKEYETLNIRVEHDNVISGVPVFGAKGFGLAESILLPLAQDYKHNGTQRSLRYFINFITYLLDQGYAYGSNHEKLELIGYSFRNTPKAIHLMREELKEAKLWEQASGMVEWYSALDGIWHPTAENQNLDPANTRTLARLGTIVTFEDKSRAKQYLLGFSDYLKNLLQPKSQEGEGIKVDFSGFHHDFHYPGYYYPALNSIGVAISFISDTEFDIDNDTWSTYLHSVQLAKLPTSSNHLPNSLTGRNFFARYQMEDALDWLSQPDVERIVLNGDYAIYDSRTEFRPEYPVGFWQMNYANASIYRDSTWVVTIKGFNKFFLGSEAYSNAGRYGRYQSYGAVELLYNGGYKKTGLDDRGWNWNAFPGTTTIHLPWKKLVASRSRQDESTSSNFAAGLRFGSKNMTYLIKELEGESGMFAMDFRQSNISPSHDRSFTFKKSVFCHEGMIICLGSDISNNNKSYFTATNLTQSLSRDDRIPVVNGILTSDFPVERKLAANQNHWILDSYNTGFLIVGGDEVVVKRSNQESPDNNGRAKSSKANVDLFYINHGSNPNQASYEYIMIPAVGLERMKEFAETFSDRKPYEVRQLDENAHILRFNEITGYAIFNPDQPLNDESLISVNEPCMLVLIKSSESLKLSVLSPDMNFTNKGLGQEVQLSIELAGRWKKDIENENINVIQKSNTTLIRLNVKDAIPEDIRLTK